MSKKSVPPIMALKVRQWLSSWDQVEYNPKERQAKPEPSFYLFTLPAQDLKALTGVYRRSTRGGQPRVKDPNVQRGHQEERSEAIREFVKYGFPWCEMGEAKRKMPGASSLRKPGWLPTAILVNILEPGALRNGKTIPANDLINVHDQDGNLATIHLPASFSGPNWEPSQVFPLEVIDGQHRLWAFERFNAKGDLYSGDT